MVDSHRTPGPLLSSVLRPVLRFMVPGVLVVFAAPFVVLLFYSPPVTDDFCKATLSFNGVPQPNVLAVSWLYYTQWTPRWFTTLLQSLAMSHVDLVAAYGWLLLGVIAANLFALWYFFRTFFRTTRGTSLVVAAIFYAAWVASLAHPEEEIFWLTGAMEYYLSLSTLLVLVSLLYRNRSSVWSYIAIVLLSIAIPAQHEIAGTFLCVILFAGVVIMRVQKLPARQWYLSLVVAALSQAAVMLSPGNALRAVHEQRHLWDIAHIPRRIVYSFYHGLDWLSYPAFLLAAFCIVILIQRERATLTHAEPPPSWLGVVGLGAMFFVLCEYSLIGMAVGWTPDRIGAWLTFMFWLLFICAILIGLPELYRDPFSSRIQLGAFTLFAVTLIGSANFRAAVGDLAGSSQAWWRRDAAQLKQRGGAIELELPEQYPKLALPQYLSSDPGCWVNRCLATYLHAKSVVVTTSPEECPQ
jgi:hypothetical protein